MSFFNNLFPFKITRIGEKDRDFHRNSSMIGGNRAYLADQSDRNFAFEDAYAQASDVYSIVNKIARTGKSLPWILNVKKGDNIDVVESGELYDIMQNPNEQQSMQEYIEESLLYILLSGNLYSYTDANPLLAGLLATPSEIYNTPPQFTEIISKYEGFINKAIGYKIHADGKEFSLHSDEIYHSKYANPTLYGLMTLYGLSPIVSGYLTLKGLVNNQTAHASILDNQGAAGILSNESDTILTPEERDVQQAIFDKKNSGAIKFGKIIQSMSKVRYTKLGLDPSALQIIEGKSLKMRDLCNLYDVSSVLFNDPQNRIQANLIPAETAMWNNAILPNVNLVKNHFQGAVVEKYNTDKEEYFITLDTGSVSALQKDAKQEAEKGRVITDIVLNIIQSSLDNEQKTLTLSKALNISYEEAGRIIGN